MIKRKLTLLGAGLLLTAVTASAQSRVTGRVVDADGQPVMGARVQLQGHKGATSTDAQGRFVLDGVPSSVKKIVVSYIGKEKQTVSISSNMNVVLKDNDRSLDEAVVVGYGRVKKGDFTGSVAALKGDKIKSFQVSNLSKALEGALPGIQLTSSTGQPGSSASIYVRGIGSINANSAPLIILDGAPYEGSLNSINSLDIESINLQKDASATSIYGARGSNGILYITTRQGKSGKTQVSVDAKWGWNSRGVSPYETVTSEKDYYELMWEAFYHRNVNKNGMSDFDARLSASQTLVKELGGYNAYNVANSALIDPMTGQLNPTARLLYHDDWNDETFSNGLRQEYNASISGGNDQTQYYISFNYLDDAAYVKKSDFNRLTGRVRIDHQAFSWLKVGANVSYAHTKQDGISAISGRAANLFSFTQYIAPIYPVYLRDLQGNLVLDDNGNKQLDQGNQYGRTRLFSLSQNPLINVYNNTNRTTRDAFNGRGYAEIKIIDGLVARADVAVDNFASYGDKFIAPITPDAATAGGYGTKSSSRVSVVNATQRLNYNKTFGERHTIGLMAGHETKAEYSSGLEAARENFYIPENNFSYAIATQGVPASADNAYHLESYLGRVEYSYDHRYSLSGSYRRDGSSMFAPENRWGNFWSVGAAWNVGEESWFKDAVGGYFSKLKLRASYGTQGNDGLLTSTGARLYGAYVDHYSVTGTKETGFSITRTYRGNRDITWEKSKTFDVGLEAGLFNNRLNFEFDFFVKNTDDMLGAHSLPSSQGSPSYIYTNEQAMRNTGVELAVNGTIIQNEKVNWSVQLNLTHYKNELTRLQEGRPAEGYQSGSYWRKKGGSLYDWYMVRFAGVDPETGDALYYKDVTKTKTDAAGNPVLDADGNPVTETVMETTTDGSTATLYQLGKSAIPTVFGGLSTSLQAYGFDLTVTTAYSLGGWTFDESYFQLMGGGNGSTFSTDIYKRWQKPGDVTNVPRLEDGYRMTGGVTNDRFLTRSDYFSLRNITLGYTLPKHVTDRVRGLSSVRVYAVGDNLFLGSHRKGLDPRQSVSGAVDTNSYSALRTISFGVNVNF